MNFSEALARLKVGQRVSRIGWHGKGMFVELQWPDKLSKMTLPYLYLTLPGGDRVPWTISQTDALAQDWLLFK